MDVYIYGTGSLAKQLFLSEIQGDVVGYIETTASKTVFREKKVYSIREVDIKKNSYIVVANTYTEEIHNVLENVRVPESQVIYMGNNPQGYGITDEFFLMDFLGDHNWDLFCIYGNLGLQKTFFAVDKATYSEKNQRDCFAINDEYSKPILKDKYSEAGEMGLYFWQDLWAAKLIHQSGVKEHYDIGSRIDGFIGHLLSMNIKVHLFDVRVFPGEVEGLDTIVTDATYLKEVEDNSIFSLSALCSLEHFGLGRYGDPVDPEACFKCFSNIQRKMVKGGHLYISVPVAFDHVEFNAHRVFCASTIIQQFDQMTLVEYSCTFDDHLEQNIDIHRFDNDMRKGANNFGLFHFVKD